MTARLWILLAAIILGVFTYLTRAILLPFMLGLAIAYLLDPLTDRLEAWSLPRGVAAGVILVLFFGLAIGMLLALWPVLQAQLWAIAAHLPDTIAGLRPWLEEFLARNSDSFAGLLGQDLDSLLTDTVRKAMSHVQDVLARVVTESLALFNVLSLLLISPVVAFYLLRDWDKITAQIDQWLPPSVAPETRRQLMKIDAVLSGFVRGQMMICLTLGVLYAIGWSLIGLDFGLVLGMFAGILAFVPYVGVFFALVIAVITAIGQWGLDPVNLGLVVGVFVVVQAFEGMILTPLLMEDRIGLHPVWVLFSAFAGGELMGFVGVLLALPVAASVAVLVRFAIERYEQHYGLGQPDETGDRA